MGPYGVAPVHETAMENIERLVPDDYIGSQILQTLLAKYNLVLTRSGEEELAISPSNIAMASLSPSNYLIPTMEVNNILLPMGLHLQRTMDGNFDIVVLMVGPAQKEGALPLPGDSMHTQVMTTAPF
jgi:hypothetical protein